MAASISIAAGAPGFAATITNEMDPHTFVLQYQLLVVNVGDTIVWTNSAWSYETNFTESFGGEWKSPPLRPGESFAFTFTNAGVYGYRTTSLAGYGVVEARSWTNAPPEVTINTPWEGAMFPSEVFYGPVLVSVAHPESTAEVQVFQDNNLLLSATNPPYGSRLIMRFEPGVNSVLVAKAIDRQGNATWSAPVTVVGAPFPGPLIQLLQPRVLPTRQLLFFYSFPSHSLFIKWSKTPDFANSTLLWEFSDYGMAIDEGVTNPAVRTRFYMGYPASL